MLDSSVGTSPRELSLRPGDHLCLFYDKDPREQMPALVPFIRDGLSRDEQFVYIADDQTVEELEGQLQQNGIDVGQECKRGALKLWTRREWRQPGEPSISWLWLLLTEKNEDPIDTPKEK